MPKASGPLLTQRALSRATLARQLLLERSAATPEELLVRLVGLQAQEATSWYTSFWTRLPAFDAASVSSLLESRAIVRIALMRSTIHLVTADDALRLRPLLQPAVERPMKTREWRKRLSALHRDTLAEQGRALLDRAPLTNVELGRALADRWQGPEPGDIAMGVRVWVPLVQVPPRGLWGQSGGARHAPLESWVGRALDPTMTSEELVTRYLGAFGPATVADAQAWSGLTGLRAVFDRLRPSLLTFSDERGRELFDLPDAPRPAEDTLAPPRFLADYDNVLLGHADRSRFITDELRKRLMSEIGMYSWGSLLVDGRVAGLWRIEREGDDARLRIRTVVPVSKSSLREVSAEGMRLFAFWAPEARTTDIDITAV